MAQQQLAAVLLFLAAAAQLTTFGNCQMTPGGCPLMFDFTQANNLSMPTLPACSSQTVNQALDMCLAPLRTVYGNLPGNTGDAQTVVNAGIGNIQCLIQRFFEVNQNNFTQYFVFMCQIADFSTKCFNAFQQSCSSINTDNTYMGAAAVVFNQDPLRNLAQMACSGATLKSDVQSFLTTNNLNTCLNTDVRGALYNKFQDLRNAMMQVGAAPMQNYGAVALSKQMVMSLCGVFKGSLGLCNMVALNATACGQPSMQALGFLFAALRPAICGTLGSNASYSTVNSGGLPDRIATATNTTFVACWGSGHMVTFTYSSGYMTCGMHNSSAPITLLRLPFTLVEALMLPFNSSTNFTYFASYKISFFNKSYGLADYILFTAGATTIQTKTSKGLTNLNYNTFQLNQDVNIVADTTKPSTCIMINDVNGRTFIRVCMFVSKQGVTGYYLGLNTLASYMDQFGTGLLRDGCPNAQSIAQFGGSYKRRRRRDDASATASTDVSSFNDPNANSMTNELSTMKTSTTSASTSNPAGSSAVKNVLVNAWTTFLLSGFCLLMMAVRPG